MNSAALAEMMPALTLGQVAGHSRIFCKVTKSCVKMSGAKFHGANMKYVKPKIMICVGTDSTASNVWKGARCVQY